jgi:hypothetical protein
MWPPIASWLLPPRPVVALAPLGVIVDDPRGLRLGAGRLRGDWMVDRTGPVGGMVMGDQRRLCGLPWPVCPDDLGQRLSSRAGTAWCPGCGRR